MAVVSGAEAIGMFTWPTLATQTPEQAPQCTHSRARLRQRPEFGSAVFDRSWWKYDAGSMEWLEAHRRMSLALSRQVWTFNPLQFEGIGTRAEVAVDHASRSMVRHEVVPRRNFAIHLPR